MKLFIKKIILFTLSFLLAVVLIETFIPQKYVTHRNWESEVVRIKKAFPGPFYPNRECQRDEYGDLAHHTEYAVLKKNVRWKSDKLGFRNNKFIQSPDVLILGRSNITGSTITQEKTLTNQLAKKTGLSCYNMAPFTFPGFVNMLEQKAINKPKTFVYGIIEWEIPALKRIKSSGSSVPEVVFKTRRNGAYLFFATLVDRIYRGNFKNYLAARVSKPGTLVQSPINKKMFFQKGKDSQILPSAEELKQHVDVICSYRDYCEKIGVEFIFFPVPNKETVYYNLVPYKLQPDYLQKLLAELNARGVKTINTLKLFTEAKSSGFIYNFDDTHWNEKGVEIVANELTNLLKKDVN